MKKPVIALTTGVEQVKKRVVIQFNEVEYSIPEYWHG